MGWLLSIWSVCLGPWNQSNWWRTYNGLHNWEFIIGSFVVVWIKDHGTKENTGGRAWGSRGWNVELLCGWMTVRKRNRKQSKREILSWLLWMLTSGEVFLFFFSYVQNKHRTKSHYRIIPSNSTPDTAKTTVATEDLRLTDLREIIPAVTFNCLGSFPYGAHRLSTRESAVVLFPNAAQPLLS